MMVEVSQFKSPFKAPAKSSIDDAEAGAGDADSVRGCCGCCCGCCCCEDCGIVLVASFRSTKGPARCIIQEGTTPDRETSIGLSACELAAELADWRRC